MNANAAVLPHPTLKLVEPEPDDGEIVCDYSSRPPLVPDGKYQAVLVRHETAFVFKTAKVFLWFRIIEPGEHYGKELYRPYRVKRLIGKPGKNGSFRLAPGSDLFSMLVRVLDMSKRAVRPDRISLRALRHGVLEIKTRTVTKDYQQREAVEWLRYSVVDDVTRQLTGA